jgi:hypothetical protein
MSRILRFVVPCAVAAASGLALAASAESPVAGGGPCAVAAQRELCAGGACADAGSPVRGRFSPTAVSAAADEGEGSAPPPITFSGPGSCVDPGVACGDLRTASATSTGSAITTPLAIPPVAPLGSGVTPSAPPGPAPGSTAGGSPTTPAAAAPPAPVAPPSPPAPAVVATAPPAIAPPPATPPAPVAPLAPPGPPVVIEQPAESAPPP